VNEQDLFKDWSFYFAKKVRKIRIVKRLRILCFFFFSDLICQLRILVCVYCIESAPLLLMLSLFSISFVDRLLFSKIGLIFWNFRDELG